MRVRVKEMIIAFAALTLLAGCYNPVMKGLFGEDEEFPIEDQFMEDELEGAIIIDTNEELALIGTGRDVDPAQVYTKLSEPPAATYSMEATYILRGKGVENGEFRLQRQILDVAGDTKNPFTGKMYGVRNSERQKVITVTFDRSISWPDDIGMFYELSASSAVKHFTISADYSGSQTYTGILAAHSSGSVMIEDVVVSGNITVTAKSSTGNDVFAGGFIGKADDGYVTFLDCASSVGITLSGESAGGFYAGGFVGYLTGGYISSSSSGSTYYSGTVTSQNELGSAYAGGVCGEGNGSIGNISVSGSIKATSSLKNALAGGIAGRSKASMTGATNSATVDAIAPYSEGPDTDEQGNAFAGGLAGRAEMSISKGSSNGKVTAEGGFRSYAGGIAGWSSSRIGGTEAEPLSASSAVTAILGAESRAYAGGITGWQEDGTITYCNVSGSGPVWATGVTSAGGAAVGYGWAGGIAGMSCGVIESCAVSGSLKVNAGGSTTTGVEEYTGRIARAGGIAGESAGSIKTSTVGTGSATSTPSMEISAWAALEDNAQAAAGGVVGFNSDLGSTLEKNWSNAKVYAYAGKETTGAAIIYAYSGGIAGVNEAVGGIKTCFSMSQTAVWANSTSEGYAGGIVGRLEAGDVANCYAGRAVQARPKGDSAGRAYAGGIAGCVANTGTTLISSNTAVQTRVYGYSAWRRIIGCEMGSITYSANIAWESMTDGNGVKPPYVANTDDADGKSNTSAELIKIAQTLRSANTWAASFPWAQTSAYFVNEL